VSKRKLLLADDSETVQKVVNLTFDLEGVEVITFGDGDSAMEQFSAVAPDVVLADVNMPGLSGYEICRRIKQNEATRQIPVILLVGSFEPFDEQKALEVGADDYLTKPFQSIRQLVNKVNELLSGDKPGRSIEAEFAETLEMEKPRYEPSDFSDPGMDDEMIQTSQVSSLPADETAKFSARHDAPVEEEPDPAKTQRFTQQDWQDIYPAPQDVTAAQAEQNPEEAAPTVYGLEDDAPQPEPAEETREFAPEETPVEEPVPVEEPLESNFEAVEREDSTAAQDDFGIQPDDIDHFYKEPDYEEEEAVEVPAFSSATEDIAPQPDVEESFAEESFTPEQTAEFQEEQTYEAYSEPAAETFEEEPAPVVETSEEETVQAAGSFEEESVSTAGSFEEEAVPAPGLIEEETAVSADETSSAGRSGEETAAEFEVPAEERSCEEQAPELSDAVPPVPVLNFDEPDLLEIPVPESLSINASDAAAEIAPPRPEKESGQESENAEVKEQVTRQMSGLNLSPEDIEAIADKVVEKLSARLKE
jgi:CheY-like chemotaxis protein